MMRRRLEGFLRTVALGALLVALWLMVRAMQAPAVARAHRVTLVSRAVWVDTTARAVVRTLSRVLTREGKASAFHANMSAVPSQAVRSALYAVHAADIGITWSDSTMAAGLAIAATAQPDPQGRTVVRAVSAVSPSPLVIRDAVGVLDSAASGARALTAMRLSRTVSASYRGSRAIVRAPQMPGVKRLLVLANAGWEAKLAMAALEERGWNIDGRLQLSPRTFVTVGRASAPDTAHYASVFVLDSGVATLAPLLRFVRQGGGVVLVGDALLDASLRSLVPARLTGERSGVAGALLTATPRDGLGFRALTPTANAVVLQYDGSGKRRAPAVVARRVGAGRIIAVGYRDSWRWRMEGTDDGANEHRAWWNMLAGAAAFVAVDTSSAPSSAFPGDAAPYADLVARLGAPRADTVTGLGDGEGSSRAWPLFVIAALALLAEWASRRLRGAP